jgi:hypothetical protein
LSHTGFNVKQNGRTAQDAAAESVAATLVTQAFFGVHADYRSSVPAGCFLEKRGASMPKHQQAHAPRLERIENCRRRSMDVGYRVEHVGFDAYTRGHILDPQSLFVFSDR